MTMSGIFAKHEHGTRARYVAGCRCAPCTAANRDRYRERQASIDEQRATVTPTGPAIEGTMLRAGQSIRVRRCPGANGSACVKGGAWLRGQGDVCAACVERATVWAGCVSPEKTRAHLIELRTQGVGYKAVAAACDVAPSALSRVLASDGLIRASTERRVLAVDAAAIADSALVDGELTRAQIAALRSMGFTLAHLGALLGYESRSLYQGSPDRVTAAKRSAVERLYRRVERGEVKPARYLVDAKEERALLTHLLNCGLSWRWLSERVGFHVQRSTRKMHPANAATVRAFRDELDAIRREGGGLPDGWESAGASTISAAFPSVFGGNGGWSWGGASSSKKRGPKKKVAPKKPRPAPLTPDERRARNAARMAAMVAAMTDDERAEYRARCNENLKRHRARQQERRAAMPEAERREQWARDSKAYRDRKKAA